MIRYLASVPLLIYLQGCAADRPPVRPPLDINRAAFEQQMLQRTLPAPPDAHLDAPLRLTHVSVPDYPMDLMRAGVQGTVAFRFCIEPDGSIRDVEIERSPHQKLSTLIRYTVGTWKFQPPLRDGVPVRVCDLRMQHVFRLE